METGGAGGAFGGGSGGFSSGPSAMPVEPARGGFGDGGLGGGSFAGGVDTRGGGGFAGPDSAPGGGFGNAISQAVDGGFTDGSDRSGGSGAGNLGVGGVSAAAANGGYTPFQQAIDDASGLGAPGLNNAPAASDLFTGAPTLATRPALGAQDPFELNTDSLAQSEVQGRQFGKRPDSSAIIFPGQVARPQQQAAATPAATPTNDIASGPGRPAASNNPGIDRPDNAGPDAKRPVFGGVFADQPGAAAACTPANDPEPMPQASNAGATETARPPLTPPAAQTAFQPATGDVAGTTGNTTANDSSVIFPGQLARPQPLTPADNIAPAAPAQQDRPADSAAATGGAANGTANQAAETDRPEALTTDAARPQAEPDNQPDPAAQSPQAVAATNRPDNAAIPAAGANGGAGDENKPADTTDINAANADDRPANKPDASAIIFPGQLSQPTPARPSTETPQDAAPQNAAQEAVQGQNVGQGSQTAQTNPNGAEADTATPGTAPAPDPVTDPAQDSESAGATAQTENAVADENERGPFFNGDGRVPRIAIVDARFGRLNPDRPDSNHGTIVKDVIETQLGADGEYIQIDEFTPQFDDRRPLADVLARAEETGQRYDYVNASISPQGLFAFLPDNDPLGPLGDLAPTAALYNHHHGLVGTDRELTNFDDLTPARLRDLGQFAQDVASGNLELSQGANDFLDDGGSRDVTQAYVRQIGNFIADGRELIRQGTVIAIAGGNDPREINGFGLLRYVNDDGPGGALVIGATNEDALQSDRVHTANGVTPTQVAPFSATRNVNVFAPGRFDSRHLGEQGVAVQGSSTAAPEVIVQQVKQRLDDADGGDRLGNNRSLEEQRRVVGAVER